MNLRLADAADLGTLLGLYTQLHGEPEPPPSEELSRLWAGILADPNRNIILVEMEREVAGSCEVMVVPNLTHHQRPYAIIENVITNPAWRRRGCAAAALEYAKQVAMRENCYKIMLMTSGREGATALYEKAGFTSEDKTAYVLWL